MHDWLKALPMVLLAFQAPAAFIFLTRLLRGASRRSPLGPISPEPGQLGKVGVVVPTLNEVLRLGPCLAGLSQQSYELRQVVIVDSHSQDGTPDLVAAIAQTDPRFSLINDPPLPPGWVGRPWALHNGFLHLSQANHPVEWFLGIDADTQPQPGLVAALLQAAETEGYDLVSLSPRFILKHPGEWWLQPALLLTLLYRFNPSGTDADTPSTVMANGQCFLCRLKVLEAVVGYSLARDSFCDDVTLARAIAERGYRVGFWDGSHLIKVRMYEGIRETWREWGRSLALRDASSTGQLLHDCWLLVCVQGLPLLTVLIGTGLFAPNLITDTWLGMNWLLVWLRLALLVAIYPSYDWQNTSTSWGFWLSPLADPIAVFRVLRSATSQNRQWRGRNYALIKSVK